MTTSNNQKNYSFSFDYLNSTFIHVTLNGKELEQPKDFTVNQNEVILKAPPQNGVSLIIYRVTPSNRIVSWTDNSILKADNLNLSYIQLMHLAEEQMDNVRDETITRALDEAWDVKGSRIKHVGTPTEDADAVPYGYVRHQKEEVEHLTEEVRQHKSTIEQAQRDVLSKQISVEATAHSTNELAHKVTEQLTTNNAEFTQKVTKAKADIVQLGQETTANITRDMTERLNSANASLNETITTANAVKEQVKSEAEKIRTGTIDEKTKNDIATALLSKQEDLITSKLTESARTQEALFTRKFNEANTTITTKISEHNADTTAHNLNKYMSMKPLPIGINNWNNLTDTGMYEATASMWGWGNAPSSTRVYYYGVVQVIKSDTNKITQVFYSYGANNKPCNICYRTFYNAWGAWHYNGDYDATITDISSHNEGLNVTKGDVTTVLKFLTTNKAETNTSLAPTLAVVKELLGSANIDITEVLKSKGVRYDFSNSNAWYLCLGQAFGNLIIQGGKTSDSVGGEFSATATFPIKFKKVLTVLGTLNTLPLRLSGANYDDNISYDATSVSFLYNKHNYIAIGVL